ncbi:MAG: diguanylate cyclase [Candidatus Sulfotelmatobacter sp.]|jgi:two-component system cell cycle response regulator|nr:diguanylate cyclase [Terriglobales bacterium]
MNDNQQAGILISERKLDKAASNTVLIAEDDPICRRVLQSRLQNWGFRVITAEDGLQAWDILRRSDPPDLLILDWVMPGIDGPELCRRIRERRDAISPYILLVTGKDDTQDVVRGLDAGADDYLSKPFDPTELRARLQVGKRTLALQHELIQAQEELRFQANHDALTGIFSRAAILSLLDRELQRAARSAMPTGIMMIDLDHFKTINDTYGHLTGDAVLKEVADRINRAVRSYDSVGRYGGEEFLAVLSNCYPDDLRTVAERIRSAVSDIPIGAETTKLTVTVSVGGIVTSHATQSLESISAADAMLYEAKRTGGNRVELGSCGLAASKMKELNDNGNTSYRRQ